MDRRKFIAGVVGALTTSMRAAGAQQQSAKIYRIGFLGTTSAAEYASNVDAWRAGLHDLGYVEGQNIVIEFRWADGDSDRLPTLAAELVRLKVDVLVTHAEGTFAAKQATASIPIVMAVTADAIGNGFVANLARPEGNVTGSTILIPEISAKRLELLKAAVPHITRVAVLVRKDSSWKTILQMLQRTGKAMNLTMQFFEVRGRAEFESAFSEMAKARVDALVVNKAGAGHLPALVDRGGSAILARRF